MVRVFFIDSLDVTEYFLKAQCIVQAFTESLYKQILGVYNLIKEEKYIGTLQGDPFWHARKTLKFPMFG